MKCWACHTRHLTIEMSLMLTISLQTKRRQKSLNSFEIMITMSTTHQILITEPSRSPISLLCCNNLLICRKSIEERNEFSVNSQPILLNKHSLRFSLISSKTSSITNFLLIYQVEKALILRTMYEKSLFFCSNIDML